MRQVPYQHCRKFYQEKNLRQCLYHALGTLASLFDFVLDLKKRNCIILEFA